MKTVYITLLLCLFSLQLEAKNAVSLNDAVNQAKKEGRVLSAKTVNGKHEIKVLTASGTVKTINKPAGNQQLSTKKSRSSYYKKGGSSLRERKQNQVSPDRFSSSKKAMKIDLQKSNLKSPSRQVKINKNTKSKEK